MNNLENELTQLLNRYSEESESNTPDFILATFLLACLKAFNAAVNARSKWYGRHDRPGQGAETPLGIEELREKAWKYDQLNK